MPPMSPMVRTRRVSHDLRRLLNNPRGCATTGGASPAFSSVVGPRPASLVGLGAARACRRSPSRVLPNSLLGLLDGPVHGRPRARQTDPYGCDDEPPGDGGAAPVRRTARGARG